MRRTILLSLGIILFTVSGYSQSSPPSADTIMKEAMQQASKEHKKVFIMFHASWCGWCHRMDSLMTGPSCKKFFSDNYVIRHLVVSEYGDKKKLENPGAEEMLVKYKGKDQGIPFWLIFDAKGNLLADALMSGENGEPANTGCPATEEEVAHFVQVLQKTSPLNKEQLQVIAKVFRKG